jgi:hypothetical protein
LSEAPKHVGRADTAKKADANRGWGSLNYVLLDSPKLVSDDRRNIQAKKRKVNEVSQEEVEVNHDGQVATGYLTILFEDKLKRDGLRKKLDEKNNNNKDMSDKYDVLKDKTNWTSGKLCSNNIFCLTNKKVVNSAQEMEDEKKQKQQDTNQFNENKERNKKLRLQEAIRRFTKNEHLCRDDLTAILL